MARLRASAAYRPGSADRPAERRFDDTRKRDGGRGPLQRRVPRCTLADQLASGSGRDTRGTTRSATGDTGSPEASFWRMIARSVGPSYNGDGGGVDPKVTT